MGLEFDKISWLEVSFKNLTFEVLVMKSNETLIKELKSKYQLDIDKLVFDMSGYVKNLDVELVKKAFYYALEAHDGQLRKDGSPYIVHPFAAAEILVSLHADQVTVAAAFLHDVPEDTKRTLEDIDKEFGEEIHFLVEGITKLSKVHYRRDMQERQIDSLRKMFLHMARDPRTVLIKLADRLHNMRTLSFHGSKNKTERIARETMEIFVPVANLLGIGVLKDELEDLCFSYLDEVQYAKMKSLKENFRLSKEKSIKEIGDLVSLEAERNDLMIRTVEKQESIYGMYRRIKQNGLQDEEQGKFLSFQILVNDVSDCYRALGVIHGLFKPILKDFKDYVAVPKANGYRGVWTKVWTMKGIQAEFEIQTRLMLCEARYGIVAHNFVEHNLQDCNCVSKDSKSPWYNKILEKNDPDLVKDKFISSLKDDLLNERIYVFTPAGDLVNLPEQACCIDFAYQIHTQIGNRAEKAIVNGKLTGLGHKLNMGDTVEIILGEENKGPAYEWLFFAKTGHAKAKIKEFFSKSSDVAKSKMGRVVLQKEFDRAGLGRVNTFPLWKVREIAGLYPNLGLESFDLVLIKIAEGVINPLELIDELFVKGRKKKKNGKMVKQKGDFSTMIDIELVCNDKFDAIEFTKLLDISGIRVLRSESILDVNTGLRKIRLRIVANSFGEAMGMFEKFEALDGVSSVRRLFPLRKIGLLAGSLLLIGFWALHPLMISFLKNVLLQGEFKHVIWSYSLLMMGFALLFGAIAMLKYFAQKNFPSLRENRKLAILGVVLNLMAIATVILEALEVF